MLTRLARGFTLIEMMAVVAIVAVLAVIATFSYKRYMRRARVMEGAAFLADIKMKQETYFMTYSRYIDTGTDADDFFPKGADFLPAKLPVNWGWSCAASGLGTAETAFCQLGITPQGQTTYFQYVTRGWAPGDANPPSEFIQNPARRWWFARARTYPENDESLTLELRLSSELVEVVELNY